jgi:hypothetical protein
LLPEFAWISPGLCDDGHDCPTSSADAYLRHRVPEILRLWAPMGFSRSPTTRAAASPAAAASPSVAASQPCSSVQACAPTFGSGAPSRSTPCWRASRTASACPGCAMPGAFRRWRPPLNSRCQAKQPSRR